MERELGTGNLESGCRRLGCRFAVPVPSSQFPVPGSRFPSSADAQLLPIRGPLASTPPDVRGRGHHDARTRHWHVERGVQLARRRPHQGAALRESVAPRHALGSLRPATRHSRRFVPGDRRLARAQQVVRRCLRIRRDLAEPRDRLRAAARRRRDGVRELLQPPGSDRGPRTNVLGRRGSRSRRQTGGRHQRCAVDDAVRGRPRRRRPHDHAQRSVVHRRRRDAEWLSGDLVRHRRLGADDDALADVVPGDARGARQSLAGRDRPIATRHQRRERTTGRRRCGDATRRDVPGKQYESRHRSVLAAGLRVRHHAAAPPRPVRCGPPVPAHRLRERHQPAARARNVAPARDGAARRRGCRSWPVVPPAPCRGAHARIGGRGRRARRRRVGTWRAAAAAPGRRAAGVRQANHRLARGRVRDRAHRRVWRHLRHGAGSPGASPRHRCLPQGRCALSEQWHHQPPSVRRATGARGERGCVGVDAADRGRTHAPEPPAAAQGRTRVPRPGRHHGATRAPAKSVCAARAGHVRERAARPASHAPAGGVGRHRFGLTVRRRLERRADLRSRRD